MKLFFIRRFGKYFLSMLIPTSIVFAVSFAMFLRSADRTITEEGRQSVRAVKTNFELVISDVLYQNDLLSNTTRMSIALKKILTKSDMTYSDSIYISSLRSALSSITTAHDYVDSIYFYLDACGYFFSSLVGSESLNISSDTSWLDIYRNMIPDELNTVVRRRQNTMIDRMETLSVFQRILLQRGCIVVNINIEKIEKMLDSMRSNPYETILVLDRNGNLLLEESAHGKAGDDLQKAFSRLFITYGRDIDTALKAVNGSWVRTDSDRYLLNTGKYETENLYIVSAIPANARSNIVFSALKTYILVISGNFLVILLLSYYITKRTFDQIKYINSVFENAEQGIFTDYETTPVKDEYGLVLNRIIHLFVNTTYLRSQLKEKEYEREVTELKALQLQINPHFLFNTLQTLDLEIRRRNPESGDLSTIIGDVSDILKYSLSDAQEWVTLDTEIIYLKKYVEIQKFRLGDQFIIYYDLDDGMENAKVFKLMFQPIVENSLRHGIRDLDRKGYIEICVTRKNNDLHCSVTDNGRGMSSEKLKDLQKQMTDEKSGNIGLANVNRRLVLKYGDEAALCINSTPGNGTCVSFLIPYKPLIPEGIKNSENRNN
jgi:two-component system, sensor histidine kinase YesM